MTARNTTYCIVKQVENALPYLGTLTESTTMKKSMVEQYIHQAETEIDQRTMTAWRDKRYTMEYDFPESQFTSSRPHSYSVWYTGLEVYLAHRYVKTLDASKGDSLEVRAGSSLDDWISTKTEGYGKDYYITPQRGILHIYRRWAVALGDRIRITYRYGQGAYSQVGTATIGSTTETFTVDSTVDFPYTGTFFVAKDASTVGSSAYFELCYYNGLTGTTFTGVSRGQEGTTARNYIADDDVWHVPEDIQHACVLRVLIKMAQNHPDTINESLGPGRDYVELQERVRQWKEEFEDIIKTRLEVVRV